MSDPNAPTVLIAHVATLSLISFGGIPGVLPDLHNFVVDGHGWLSDRDFANIFAITQATPGPNMLLLMAFVGWKVGGLPTAIGAALAIFTPSCTACFATHQFWNRFRAAAWQRVMRRGLAPVTIGLVIAGGTVMAHRGDTGWASLALTVAAAAIVLTTRLNPLWILALGGALGGLGVL